MTRQSEPIAWQSKLTGAITTTPATYDYWCEEIGAENITPLYAAPPDTAALQARVTELQEKAWVMVPVKPTDAMLDAAMDNLNWWVEPVTAPRECGVPLGCDISADEAANFNAEQKSTIASIYAAMLAANGGQL